MGRRQGMVRRVSKAGFLALVWLLAISAAATAEDTGHSALCAPAGVAERLGLGLDPQGRVSLPDPTDPEQRDAFWRVHNGLTATIETELARSKLALDPVAAARHAKVSGPRLPPYWRATAVGAGTMVSELWCPVTHQRLEGHCAVSAVGSPLSRLEPFGTLGDVGEARFFWQVVSGEQAGPRSYPGLLYAEPTVHPCISTLRLAAASTLTTCLDGWILHEGEGEAFLIVDNCVDLYDAAGTELKSAITQDERKPRPSVAFIAAIHQSCPGGIQCCAGTWQPCQPR